MKRGTRRGAAKAGADAGVLRLDGELTIYRAQELQQILVGALAAAAGADVKVDLSGAGEIDSAGVQVLLAARRSAADAGGALVVRAASPAVQAVVGLLGLTSELGPAGAHGAAATGA